MTGAPNLCIYMPQHAFSLHPQLVRDTCALGQFPLCRVLLLNEAHYPWVIAVPQRDAIREIYELTILDQQQLLSESVSIGRVMMQIYVGDKLNVGALGNLVPQLHLHHIVRRREDPAWPGPAWGHAPLTAYAPAELNSTAQALAQALAVADTRFQAC